MPRLFPLFTMLYLACALVLAVPPAQAEEKASAHDFAFNTIDGDPLPLSTYQDKVLVVVNTASECGFTYQYEGLQSLWSRYKDQGVVVLGVPSNDFGGQEPGKEEDIKNFCEHAFGVDFPLTEKISVKGEGAHPFYVWARETAGDKAVPQWNFHKIVVDAKGQIAGAFASGVEPLDPQVTDLLDGLIPGQ